MKKVFWLLAITFLPMAASAEEGRVSEDVIMEDVGEGIFFYNIGKWSVKGLSAKVKKYDIAIASLKSDNFPDISLSVSCSDEYPRAWFSHKSNNYWRNFGETDNKTIIRLPFRFDDRKEISVTLTGGLSLRIRDADRFIDKIFERSSLIVNFSAVFRNADGFHNVSFDLRHARQATERVFEKCNMPMP